MLREKPVQVSRWAKANTWSANEGAAWERPADFYKFLPQHPGMYMEDEACAEALARGFARFVKFLVASKLDATAFASRGSRRCACSSQELDCRLKISLSHSEGKFVAISTTQNKRLCLRQKAVLGLEKRH